MKFTVGAVEYVVARQWELTFEGKDADGYCAASLRTIFLNADLGDEMVEQTLRHEHAHAWEFEVGVPSSVEDRANFAATVGATFDRDFKAGGGKNAILLIAPGGLRPATRKREPADVGIPKQSSDRIECGRCGCPVLCGSIYTSAPRTSDHAMIRIVDRGCTCPGCRAVQVWTERVSQDGLPLGEFYSAQILVGDAARKWCAEHPVADYSDAQC